MAELKWIKITTDIFDDEKILLIESLPESDSIIVIWFKLLCLAGKQNNHGVFMINDRMPYTEKMLSAIFRRKETTVKLALDTFKEFGMIEIIDDVITIPNWGKHQNLDKLEEKNAYMRQYMADYRARQKALISGEEPCKTNSKSNSKTNVNPIEEKRKEEAIEEETEKQRDSKSQETEKPKVNSDHQKVTRENIQRLAQSEALTDAMMEFVDHRIRMKAPMTFHAVDLMLRELQKLAPDDEEKKIQILERSILKGWKGVFELQEEGRNNNGDSTPKKKEPTVGNDGYVRDSKGVIREYHGHILQ